MSVRFLQTSLLAALIALPGSVHAVGFEVVVRNDFVSGRVSPDGAVVVGGSASASGNAFRWVNGTPTSIVSGVNSAGAAGASEAGSVVVGVVDDRGFRWEGGAHTLIPLLPGGGSNFASEVTPDGGVIVGASRSAAAGGSFEAFRLEGTTLVGLGDLPGGGFESFANAVDASGSVIVGSATSASGVEATRWAGLVASGLGDVAGGAFSSVARDVSDDGSVVVGAGTDAAGEQAIRWDAGGLQVLGDLGNGTSHAFAVSGDGTRIGGRSGSDAFIWDRVHGMQDIEQLLTLAGTDLQGLELLEVQGISQDGETLVGIANDTIEGGRAVWIATGVTPEVLGFGVPAASWPARSALAIALLLAAQRAFAFAAKS